MPRGLWMALLLMAGCLAPQRTPPAAGPEGGPHPGELWIFAAASLRDPFQELAQRFEAQHPGIRVHLNLGASSALRTQLLQGAQADLFASADEKNMEEIVRAGLVAEGPYIFATNQPVLIVPADNPARISQLADLARPGARIALPGPEVPIGAYARSILQRASQDPAYGPDFAERVLRNVVSEEANVKAAFARVALGEADAAFVYRTDVGTADREKVRVVEIPEAFNVVARYPIALLKGARHPTAARAFMALVRSSEGQGILQRWGFGPP